MEPLLPGNGIRSSFMTPKAISSRSISKSSAIRMATSAAASGALIRALVVSAGEYKNKKILPAKSDHHAVWSLPCCARTIRIPAKMIKPIPAMLSIPGITPQNAQLKIPTEIK